MSSFNCCFFTCIQISQEAGQVVWYSHIFKSFPQFVVIHTAKGFSVVNEAKVSVLEFSFFLYDQTVLAIWSVVPVSFLNPTWTSESSWFMYCWSLAWRILSITLLPHEMRAILWYFEHSLALPFFGIGMKAALSNPLATAEFSKFAGILSIALPQYHLLGFEIAQLEFHHPQ